MADNNEGNESFQDIFDQMDTIELPGSEDYRHNGHPPVDVPVDMDAQARAEGYIPAEERGAPPFSPDFLASGNTHYSDDVHHNTPEDEEVIDQYSYNEDAPGEGATTPADTADGGGYDGNANERAPAAPDGEADANDAADEADRAAGPQPMPGGGQPAGAGSILANGLVGGARSLSRGARALGALGVAGVGGAALYSAKGARWGWQANQRQRQEVYQRWADKTVTQSESLNTRFNDAMARLEGTDYLDLARQRSALQSKDKPTRLDRKQIDSMGEMMRRELQTDIEANTAVKDVRSTLRDAERVAKQSEKHVARGAMSEDTVESNIKPNLERFADQASDQLKGMVDTNGTDMAQRAREAIDRMLKALRGISEALTGGRAKSASMSA